MCLYASSVEICCQYNWECNKVVKTDRRLMQRCGYEQYSETRTFACTPLANTDSTKNSKPKSALLGILSTGVEIATAVSPYVSNAMVGACVLIDGHALIQNLGKPAGCRTIFSKVIFSKLIFSHFS